MQKSGIAFGTLMIGILCIYFLPKILWIGGYYITSDEKALAHYLVSHELPPSNCLGLIHFDRFAPPVSEKRLDCITQYASIVKDPSICESLMPSIFFTNCIGLALPEIESPGSGINCEVRNSKMYCYSSQEKMLTNEQDVIVDLNKCEEISDVNERNWCYIVRVKNISTDESNCLEVVQNREHTDLCYFNLAMKTKDVSECEKIQNKARRVGCQLLLKRY